MRPSRSWAKGTFKLSSVSLPCGGSRVSKRVAFASSTATEPDPTQLVNAEAAEVFERRRRAELLLRKEGPAVPDPIGSGAELEQLIRIGPIESK
jgi:hypothetical protein